MASDTGAKPKNSTLMLEPARFRSFSRWVCFVYYIYDSLKSPSTCVPENMHGRVARGWWTWQHSKTWQTIKRTHTKPAEVLFTIFVPALFLTGTHATLQAREPKKKTNDPRGANRNVTRHPMISGETARNGRNLKGSQFNIYS
jgi:hypothetical protein